MVRFPCALTVVGCLAALVGAGCGNSKGKGNGPDMTGVAGQALHVISTPVNYAQVGEDLKYQTVLSKPGAADCARMARPQGAKIDQGGSLPSNPTEHPPALHSTAPNAHL